MRIIRARAARAGMATAAVAILAQSVPAAAQSQAYRLDIPAQGLGSALHALARATHQQLAFDNRDLAGKRTTGIRGSYTVREALDRLLAGSGLFVESGVTGLLLIRPSGNSATGTGDPTVSVAEGSSDIVVTAQKRAERLIDTPQSVTALRAVDLAKFNQTRLADFAADVPGLQLNGGVVGGTAVSLRGVTTGVDVGSTIGIYVDEVPYGSSSSNAGAAYTALDVGLFDLDRVEVLRGPQGTLYGASSLGGVLKYVTQKPSLAEFGGSIRGGVSDTRGGGLSFNGAAVLNVPVVTDKVAVRASGYYNREGGFTDDIGIGQRHAGRANIYGGRLDGLVRPTEKLSLRLTGFVQNIRHDGLNVAYYNPDGSPVSGDVIQSNLIPQSDVSRFRLGSATLSYDFGAFALTSVSSYQYTNYGQTVDLSSFVPLLNSIGIPATAVATVSELNTRKFTQELRLASSPGHRLEWQIGAFYTHEKSNLLSSGTTYGPGMAVLPIDLLGSAQPSVYQEYAAFGDVTYHVTDKLDVTGGIRYARNQQRYFIEATGLLVAPLPEVRSHEGVATYLADARYRFNRNVMAYARFATGYRPGGPTARARDLVTGAFLNSGHYDSDTLQSYEMGLKAETPDRTFSIDGAGYYINWKNIVLTTGLNGSNYLANAGNAHIKGAELTLVARPDRGLTFSGAFAYNDGRLVSTYGDIGAVVGERLPNSAHFTASLSGDYVLQSSPAKPYVGAKLRYVGDRYAAFAHNAAQPQFYLPDYTTVDLRAGLRIGAYDAQIFVRNLLDKRGALGASTFTVPLGGPVIVTPMQPRTIGFSLTTKY